LRRRAYLLPLRAGAGQDQAADHVGTYEDDLLSHAAAEREAEQVNHLQAQGVDEGESIPRHLGHGAGYGPGRAAHAGIVDQNDFALGGDGADQHRIPAVEAAAIAHEADQRQGARALVAKATRGERREA
jgi:hypothetical protein